MVTAGPCPVLLVIVQATGPARPPSSPAGGQGHLCLLAHWFIGHTCCWVCLWEQQVPAWPPLCPSPDTGHRGHGPFL